MPALPDVNQRWEVRPSLRLARRLLSQADVNNVVVSLGELQAALLGHPNVAFARAAIEFTGHSEGITATITFTQPSSPGAAADEATTLLINSCVAVGVMTDLIREVVVEMADVDPRSL